MSTTDFQHDYLSTWTEPDARARREVIDRVWSPTGHLAVSSLGITIEGAENIAAHVGAVHDDLIAGKGLVFRYDQAVESGDGLLLRWSMLTPAGDVVGRGADLVFRDDEGRARAVYMFMGVN